MKHLILIIFVIPFFINGCSNYFSSEPSYYTYAADISTVFDSNYVVPISDFTDLGIIDYDISFSFTQDDFKDPNIIERLNQLEWGVPKYYKKYYFEEPPDSIKPPYVFYGLKARNRKPDNNEKQRYNSKVPPTSPYIYIKDAIREVKKANSQLIMTDDVWMLKSKEYESVNFFEQTFKGITEYYVYFFDYNFENGMVWFDKNYHIVRLENFGYGTGLKGAIGYIDLNDRDLPLSDYDFVDFL